MDIANILYMLTAFGLSTITTFILMPMLLRLCKRRGMYDIPDERKVHRINNIPRLGGVLFIPAMSVGVAGTMVFMMTNNSDKFSQFNMSTILVIIGMFLLYLIGLLDDLFGMPATLKFAIQLIVSIFLPFCGLYIHDLYGLFGLEEIPAWLSFPITVFVSLLIVNAINLIDGIDGLASSLSFLAILAFGILYYFENLLFYSLYCMGLLGSILVFFIYNIFGNPQKGTKTFMGDTGSLTLGYALAFLTIRYIMIGNPQHVETTDNNNITFLVPFTLVIVPCFDLVRVACLRIKRGVSIFFPDKTHIHHKCLHAGFSMHGALGLIIALQLSFCLINYLLLIGNCCISVIVGIDIAIFMAFNLWLNYKIRKNELRNAAKQ